jgi:PAS domain S-box-containing protein
MLATNREPAKAVKRAKARRRSPTKSRVRYDLVMGAINESVYDWDIAHDRFVTSGTMQRLLGVPRERLSLAGWQESIHPEDFPRFRAATIAHLKGETDRFECDYRFKAQDGTWRWARTHGLATRDRKGRAIRMVGSTGDITELKSTEEQQAAITEILTAMTGSLTDTRPVFETIARSAMRLCDGAHCALFRYDGRLQHFAAHCGVDAETVELLQRRYPRAPDPARVSGRAIIDREVIHLADALSDPRFPGSVETLTSAGNRAVLAVPMLKAGEPIGVIFMVRPEARPFSERQVRLLKTFADQAVIAIENQRLFNETREALDRQIATAEILTVMSNSTTDVQPVFDAIVKNVQRLFGTSFAVLQLVREGRLELVAYDGQPGFERITAEFPRPLSGDSIGAKAIRARGTVQLAPIVDNPQAPERSQRMARTLGYNSLIGTPMVRADGVIGAIVTGHPDGRPFTDKQAALLRAFADQAVIAIENVRLFNETKEALERQTATADVLKVISRSTFDLQTVLDTLVESATRLCGADHAWLFQREGEFFKWVASFGHAADVHARLKEYFKDLPVPADRGSVTGRVALEGKVVEVPDVLADPAYTWSKAQEIGGYRSALGVPLLREGTVVGVIFLARNQPQPFSPRQIELATTFADQAVIAIQNVRLFNETKEALEHQKASGEVLEAISGSIADTQPVFDKILDSCERLFEGRIVGLNIVRDDGLLHIGAYHGEHRQAFEQIFPIPLDGNSGSAVALRERRVIHFPDAAAPDVPASTRRGCKAIGIRSVIFAPVLWEGRALGSIFVGRDHVSTFSQKETALLKTFADQAAIAIENARLFKEIQDKSRQLEIASRHKSEFLANMSHELRTPLNAIIGFTRIVMRRSKEVIEDKQYENLEKILASGQHLLALINAILDLSKIEAGHIEVFPEETALAPVLEQCVRTVEPLVKVSLVREFDGALPAIYVDEEKLRQIVINLLSNAAKFTEEGAIRVRAQASNGSVAIAVADTGIGIPQDKLGLIFEEFEQVDASSTREHGGTGLGLAIARRLARLMGGDIGVESAPGKGSTFTLTLPLRYPS